MGFTIIRECQRSLTHGAVVSMIAPRPAATPGDDQGGSDDNADPSLPGHDQGGQDDADGGRAGDIDTDRSDGKVPDSSTEYDTLITSLHQRISEVETASASRAQLNPFQTPSTFQTLS